LSTCSGTKEEALDAYDHASSAEIATNMLHMKREMRNTVVKIEGKDRADGGGVVTRDMSCEVDPFCNSGVRSVGASARRFPLSAAGGEFMIVVTGHVLNCI